MSRFIGRKASPCPKCKGSEFFVNRIGGIQCERCSPPKLTSDVQLRLRIEGGTWQDQSVERFDLIDIDLPSQVAVKPVTPAPSAVESQSEPLSRADVRQFGSLSMNEIELFLSDDFWNCGGQQSGPVSASTATKQKRDSDFQIEPFGPHPLPDIGLAVQINRTIPLFGGVISVGSMVICGAYRDGLTRVLVDLSATIGGPVIVAGLDWPIQN